MNGAQDLNLNATECLVRRIDFGVMHIHNVCNGSVVDVPWGMTDWAAVALISGIGGACFFLLVAMAVGVIRDF